MTGRRLLAAAALAWAFTGIACTSFDPGAPFTLSSGAEEEPTPIPEGTPIIDHDAVPIEARTERIELIEDLRLRGGATPFYRTSDIAVDADGSIFVFDGGNRNILMFDAQGNYLRSFGRAGQGPGELGPGGDIAVADGQLVHAYRNRINAWSPAGAVISSRAVPYTTRLTDLEGTDDGGVVGFARQRSRERGTRQAVVRLDIEGYRERTYADLPNRQALAVIQGSRGRNTGLPRPVPDFAAARSGEVYVTSGGDYAVLALSADASPRWALQVDWPRIPVTDERIDRALARVMGLDGRNDDIPSTIRNVRRSDVDWPEHLPALMGMHPVAPWAEPLRVDGHGHLYVFPFLPEDWEGTDQPVDVYSRDGEHLFSGLMPLRFWATSRGDFVYGVEIDPETEEPHVVRYRLLEPF